MSERKTYEYKIVSKHLSYHDEFTRKLNDLLSKGWEMDKQIEVINAHNGEPKLFCVLRKIREDISIADLSDGCMNPTSFFLKNEDSTLRRVY